MFVLMYETFFMVLWSRQYVLAPVATGQYGAYFHLCGSVYGKWAAATHHTVPLAGFPFPFSVCKITNPWLSIIQLH